MAGGSRSGKQVAGEEGQVVRLQVQVVAKSRCQVKLNRREGEGELGEQTVNTPKTNQKTRHVRNFN